MSHIVALSGRKGSTAMALWLAENIHRDDFDGVAVDAISHPLQDSGLVAIRQNVNQGGYADVREHAPGTMNQEQFVNPKPLRGMRLVGGIELGDVLTEDVADVFSSTPISAATSLKVRSSERDSTSPPVAVNSRSVHVVIG